MLPGKNHEGPVVLMRVGILWVPALMNLTPSRGITAIAMATLSSTGMVLMVSIAKTITP